MVYFLGMLFWIMFGVGYVLGGGFFFLLWLLRENDCCDCYERVDDCGDFFFLICDWSFDIIGVDSVFWVVNVNGKIW